MRSLHQLPGGACVIDTPGVNALEGVLSEDERNERRRQTLRMHDLEIRTAPLREGREIVGCVAIAQDVTVPPGPSGTAYASINNGSSDPDGDPLTIALMTPPQHGEVTLLPTGEFTYVPSHPDGRVRARPLRA